VAARLSLSVGGNVTEALVEFLLADRPRAVPSVKLWGEHGDRRLERHTAGLVRHDIVFTPIDLDEVTDVDVEPLHSHSHIRHRSLLTGPDQLCDVRARQRPTAARVTHGELEFGQIENPVLRDAGGGVDRRLATELDRARGQADLDDEQRLRGM